MTPDRIVVMARAGYARRARTPYGSRRCRGSRHRRRDGPRKTGGRAGHPPVYGDDMTTTGMDLDRYCAELTAQTDSLRAHVEDKTLTTPVPTCPGWTLGDLVRHLGGAHRWAERIVRTRATGPVPDDQVNDVSGDDGASTAQLTAWLAEGAARLADTLRAAGPDVPVWTVAPGGTPVFWARRMLGETVVHRADAAGAVGADYTLDPAVALDGLDEWLEFSVLPQAFASREALRDLLAPGRTLHFHATDAGPGAGEWLVDLTGDAPARRRAHEKAAVAVRGPAAELLLLMYQRQSVRGDGVEILGDTALFDLWRERVSAWLRR